MEILVLGWYGHDNCGDDSYQLSIPKIFPNIRFSFVDKIRKEDVEKYDAVVLGGGNVFKPDFFRSLEMVKNKPIYALSVGIEGFVNTKICFSHIYIRENDSLEIAKKMGIPCSFLPDAAFILEGSPEKGKKLIKKYFDNEKNDLYTKLVVVVMNSYLIGGGLEGMAKDAITFLDFSYRMARVMDETPASFLFLPFCTKLPPDDRVSNSWIASKCKYWKKNCVIFDKPGVQDTLDIISASDLVISTRLHSSIFAYNEGVSFIDITHHSKNEGFLRLIEKNDCSLSFWNMDFDELKLKINIGLKKKR